MKRLLLSQVILGIFISISAILAQGNSKAKPALKPAGVKNILSITSPQNLWDIDFTFYASLDNSDHGNAGAAYIPDLKEVWTSHFNSNQLYRWTSHQHAGTSGVLDSVYPFTVKGVTNVRAMTFDGNYVYAVNNSDSIFKITPVAPTLIGVIIAPISVRYITFDPTANQSNGGFWIGNFETDAELINYNGNVLKTIPYADLGTTVIYGAAFDNYSPNGPYLWFFGQTGGYTFPQEISQVSLQTGNATGLYHDVNPDFATLTDSALAGGLFIANGLVPGKVTLGGIIQCPARDLLFGYEIATSSNVPVNFMINKTFSFGDHKASSSYRILSLPGDISIPVSQIVGGAGQQKKDWNVYYDNGQADNYLVEYNNSSSFLFTPGKAFWMLSRNPLSISQQATSVSTNGNNYYSIPLHPGWNLISSPFTSAVNWDFVKFANNLGNNELIYAWNGSWSNPVQLSPYEGYYYNNIDNLALLDIPSPSGKVLGKTTNDKTDLSRTLGESDYGLERFVKVSLFLDEHEVSYAYAAIKSNSSFDFDQNDYFAPPSDFCELNLFLRDEKLSTQYKDLFIDTRPEINDGQIYNLFVKNTTEESPSLRFSGLENFKDYEIYLIDNRLNRFYNLKEIQEIQLNSFHKGNEFSLIIGKNAFIENKKKNSSPESYLISQNYPNPFNPSTIITYELPVKSWVELKVYDAVGREVASLVSMEQPAGKYEVNFTAENLSSGIYFYTIRAGNFVKTQKMLLLR